LVNASRQTLKVQVHAPPQVPIAKRYHHPVDIDGLTGSQKTPKPFGHTWSVVSLRHSKAFNDDVW
jgi:hypothetical protein